MRKINVGYYESGTHNARYPYVERSSFNFQLKLDKTDPQVIQEVVDRGLTAKYFAPGDELIIPWTDRSGADPVTYDYPFVVTHIGDVRDRNGRVQRNALWMMAKYATPHPVVFDGGEQDPVSSGVFVEGTYYYVLSGSNYSQRTVIYGNEITGTYYRHYLNSAPQIIRYGYNRWSASALRKWLNSEAQEWWYSSHTGDGEPDSSFSGKPGWISGFDSEWKKLFKPVKVDTVVRETGADTYRMETTDDIFFIPGVEQAYGVPSSSVRNIGSEGAYWEYWQTIAREYNPARSPFNGSSNNTLTGRKIKSIASIDGDAVYSMLRTMDGGNIARISYMHSKGYICAETGDGVPNDATHYYAQPCFVIHSGAGAVEE